MSRPRYLLISGQLSSSRQVPFGVDGKYHFSSIIGSRICISPLNLYLFLLWWKNFYISIIKYFLSFFEATAPLWIMAGLSFCQLRPNFKLELPALTKSLFLIIFVNYLPQLYLICNKSNIHLMNFWEWVLNRNLNHSVRGSNPLLTGSEDTVTRPLRQWRKNFLFQHKPSEEKS